MTTSQDHKKILIIRHGALGDIIFTLGCMAAIRNHHQDADITLLTTEPFVGFLYDTGFFNHIIIDDKPKLHHIKKAWALRQKLRYEKFDIVYDLQTSGRTIRYFYLIFCPYPPRFVGRAKWASDYDNAADWAQKHTVNRLEGLIYQAGINNIPKPALHHIKNGQKPSVLKDIKQYALCIPGTSAHRHVKKWSDDYYADIACWLYRQKNLIPVIIGSYQEHHSAIAIQHKCPEAINLTGKTKIADIASLSQNANFIIGNDTGPTIISALSNKPTLVLYCQETSVKHSLPIGTHVDYIQKDDINTITVNDVMAKINQMLYITHE